MKCAAIDCDATFEPDKFNPGRHRFCSERCRKRIKQRELRADPAFRQRDHERSRRYFENLAGMDYVKRQLQVRRNMANLRRRRRSLGASGSEGHKEA